MHRIIIPIDVILNISKKQQIHIIFKYNSSEKLKQIVNK